MLRILVLGAAAGGGLPQWNCNAINSASFWRGDQPLQAATQCSIAVTADGSSWALVNASPDIRAQIIARRELHPRAPEEYGLRDSPVRSVLLTNGDIDHIAGLLTLRERHAFDLFATAEIHRVLSGNPIFNALDPELVKRRETAPNAPFEIVPDLRAELFPVPGKIPLFLEGDAVVTDLIGEQTVGVRLSAADRTVFFIPGCARLTAELRDKLQQGDVLFFDGTVFHDDEMQREGVGQKTGRRMGHMPMSGDDGSLQAFRDIDIGRKIYIHINNTNPVWRPHSPERQEAEAAGWEIAFDGMEITL